MRLPFGRFTVRRLMIGVAIVAMLLGIEREICRVIDRAREYKRLAQSHQRAENFYRQTIRPFIERATENTTHEAVRTARRSMGRARSTSQVPLVGRLSILERNDGNSIREISDKIKHHYTLRIKYEKLQLHPWEYSMPDPAPPLISSFPW